MISWLRSLNWEIPETLTTPSAVARYELDRALPGVSVGLEACSGPGDGYRIEKTGSGFHTFDVFSIADVFSYFQICCLIPAFYCVLF